MNTQFNKAETLYSLHQQEQIFMMPSAWDMESAKALVLADFWVINLTA